MLGLNHKNIIPLAIPDGNLLDNTVGLVNYTCESFTYVDWDGTRLHGQNKAIAGICLNTNEADHGSYTRNNGAKVTLRFFGKRISILAWKQENSGMANVKIDDKIVERVSFNSGGGRRAGIVFTSDELPYGEHVIEVQHNDTHNAKSMVIGGAYVDPFPPKGGYILSYDNFGEREGKWALNSNPKNPSTFSCDQEGCSGVFRFYGTKFWLTGLRSSTEGNMRVIVDGQSYTVSKSSNFDIAQRNNGVLLYMSDQLPAGYHTVKVERTNQKITLTNLFYTTYPAETLPIPPVNHSILTNPTGMINYTCDQFQYTDWEAMGRGGICVSKWDANHGSFTRHNGAKAKLNFIGSRVHILAWKQENSGNAKIIIDGEHVSTVNFNSNGPGGQYRLPGMAFSSSDLQFGEHTLEIVHNDTENTKSVVFAGAYVESLPYYGGYVSNLNDLNRQLGDWAVDSSTVPPTFKCSSDECAGTFNFYGTRFWLTGLRSSQVGKLEISIDHGPLITINKVVNAEIAQNNIPILLYLSDQLEFKEHEIRIYKKETEIKLVDFFYTIYPYARVPAKTPVPSPEATPVETDAQSITINDYNKITECGTDKRYEKEVYNYDSVLVKIEVSSFDNVRHNDKGGAVHIINAGIRCSNTHYNHCKSVQGSGGAVHISNTYNYKMEMSFDGTIFNDCEALYGGAIYLYSNSDKNTPSIINCEFTNSRATTTKETNVNGKYGGGGIFITAKTYDLSNNHFIQSTGSVCMIYNKFDNPNSRLLSSRKSGKISYCTFETTKDSTCALYCLFGQGSSNVELSQCTFKGELSSGNDHYIDGESEVSKGPKLIITKCKFASTIKKAINLESNNDFFSIDYKDQYFEFEDNGEVADKKTETWKILVSVLVPAVLAVVIISVLVVVILKRKNSNVLNENEIPDETSEVKSDAQINDKTLNAPLL